MLAVRPDSVPYFYGRITRENAEHILVDRGSVDGMYLLRSSSSLDSDYVISLCFNKQVLHYRIEKSDDDMYFLCGAPQEKYNGPIELVENIKMLPCKLMIPCIKPLHIFMPGVNCGISDDKLQEAIQKKCKDWGLSKEELNAVLEDKNSDIWKIVLKSLHELEFWFHGKINRPEAEKRLAEHGLKDGTFLIREHDERSFSLSLCHSGIVKHYKIDVLSSGEVGIQDGPRFDNIISLVSHYSVFSDGLWCTLQQPCERSDQLGTWNLHSQKSSETAEVRLGLSNVNRKISSPIASHRTGLITKDSSSVIQDENKNRKTSSKSKASSTSKGSSKIGTWLKNPVAFLSRSSQDNKVTEKTNKPQQNKDKEVTDGYSSALNTPVSNQKPTPPPVSNPRPTPPPVSNKRPTPPPVPKKSTTSKSIVAISNSLPTPVSDLDMSASPSFDLSKDHNHNDCEPNEPKKNGETLLEEIPSSPSHINNRLTIQEALNAHLSKVISEQNVPGTEASSTAFRFAGNHEQLPQTQKPASALNNSKPVPFPRQKKISCPALPSPRAEAEGVSATEQNRHSVGNFLFSSGVTKPSMHSPINESISSPLQQEISPTLDNCDDPQLIPQSKSLDNLALSDSAAVAPATSPKPLISPRVPILASKTSALTNVITELKRRHIMNSTEQLDAMPLSDSKVECATSSIAPEVVEISKTSKNEQSDNTNELEKSNDTGTFSEINPMLSGSVVLQKNVSEQSIPNDPLYEEIDPEYENSRSKITTSCVINSVSDVNEVPTVPSVTYEDSKWEDNKTDESNVMSGVVDPDTSDNEDKLASKFSDRRKKFSKEQSEFHYKTIKRHRKGPEMIDRKLIHFQEKIGLGHFGQVMKATFKSVEDEVPCAVKTLKRDEIGTAKGEILREARIMTSLDHPHIVRLLGICEGEPFLLVMELAPLGSLCGYLKQNNNVPVSHILSLMYQVATGMEYLESKQFVHRDLAARNVLLVNESFAKISDFGMSKALGLHAEYYTVEPKGKLPLKWYAPECIYFFKFSTKSDVWSYGITLWEALSYGGKPYVGMAGRDILKMFSTSERLPCPKNCPKEIYSIMLNCWEIRPEMRPSFSKLSSHLREYSLQTS